MYHISESEWLIALEMLIASTKACIEVMTHTYYIYTVAEREKNNTREGTKAPQWLMHEL